MAFVHNANHGQLVITGPSTVAVSLMTPAWRVLNLQTLRSSAPVVGSDRNIPGYVGSLPFRRRATAGTYSLEMLIGGDVDQTGAAYSGSHVAGMDSNINYLLTNLCAQPTTTAGTQSAVLTLSTTATVTRDIHVLGLTVGESIGWGKVRAVLDISVPLGSF